MKMLKDIKVVAFPKLGFARAEGETAEGMVFMKRQYDRLDAEIIADNVNIFLDALRGEGLTYTFKAF